MEAFIKVITFSLLCTCALEKMAMTYLFPTFRDARIMASIGVIMLTNSLAKLDQRLTAQLCHGYDCVIILQDLDDLALWLAQLLNQTLANHTNLPLTMGTTRQPT